MARRTKAEAEETRETLLDAAETVFLSRGVSKASLEAVAQEGGVTRGAVYWHFRNKTDLFEAMLDRVHLPFVEVINKIRYRVEQDPMEILRQSLIYSLEELAVNKRKRRVYTILLHRCEFVEATHPLMEKQTQITREAKHDLHQLLLEAQDGGRLHAGIAADVAAEVIHAFMLGIVSDWLRDPDQYALETQARPMVETLLRGFVVSE